MSPAGAARVRASAAPTRLVPPGRPRRVSGPARPQRSTPSRTGTPASSLAINLGSAARAAAAALDRQTLLDRLIRGRAWIGIVAFALIGIVTLQLGLLQLNSRIGRALERTSVLQRENSSISVENAHLASPERIEALAAGDGMRATSETSLRFLGASHFSPAIVARAARALASPPAASTSTSTATAEAESVATQNAAASAAAEGAVLPSAGETQSSAGSDPGASTGAEPGASGTTETSPPAAATDEQPAAANPPATGAPLTGGEEAGSTQGAG